MKPMAEGRVYFVGAGPGDPQLLTRRGEALLRRADVVFYDFLTNEVLLELAPSSAERINVGKRAGGPAPTQESIHERIIAEARRGRMVVRLKGGDCFVFGRGGEEAQAMIAAEIAFEVVPGVTSAIAVPALAGIPVTHRGVASMLHVVTGHEDPRSPECSVRWDLLAAGGGTIIVLMGAPRLAAIAEVLIGHGMSAKTPAALVQSGAYPNQLSHRLLLGEIAKGPEAARLQPPSLAVIGAVAGMEEALNWFERRPLFGRRIVLTRPANSGPAFGEAMAEAGAQVREFPAVRLEPASPGSRPALAEALRALGEVKGWLALPSPAAIRYFFQALAGLGLDSRSLGGVKLAVIGERSARDLAEHGLVADFHPEQATGAQLAASLPLERPSQRILIAGSSRGRPELRDGLRARGFEVFTHDLYTTTPNEPGTAELRRALGAREVDAVAVFSPSAAEAIAASLGPDDASDVAAAQWFALGSTTAHAMCRLGFQVGAIVAGPTAEQLIAAMLVARANPQHAAG